MFKKVKRKMGNVIYKYNDDNSIAYGKLPNGTVFVIDADMVERVKSVKFYLGARQAGCGQKYIIDSKGRYLVRYNSSLLSFIEAPDDLEPKIGTPESFYIKNDKLMLYPTPQEKGLVTVDYMTLVIGETVEGEEIYSLKNDSDILTVPVHLEELMKEAIITRTMLNSIASESDENYSAYKKQADRAFRLLVKYSKGVGQDKSIKF